MTEQELKDYIKTASRKAQYKNERKLQLAEYGYLPDCFKTFKKWDKTHDEKGFYKENM